MRAPPRAHTHLRRTNFCMQPRIPQKKQAILTNNSFGNRLLTTKLAIAGADDATINDLLVLN